MDKTKRMTMSEARLNDLVYMLLKYLFFQGAGFGSPRECDIRVCMQMAVPELRTGTIADAILLPTERSGRSHERTLDVCFGTVFDECLEYLEDHWMKQTFEEAYGKPNVKQEMWDFCCQPGSVFEVVKNMPEDQCAADGAA